MSTYLDHITNFVKTRTELPLLSSKQGDQVSYFIKRTLPLDTRSSLVEKFVGFFLSHDVQQHRLLKEQSKYGLAKRGVASSTNRVRIQCQHSDLGLTVRTTIGAGTNALLSVARESNKAKER